MVTWIHDLRHACRTIARMPIVSAVVVLSLAAGIGVNTVVFSWIQARMLRPLPGVERAGSGFINIEPRNDSGQYPGSSWPEYRDLRERLQSFEQVIATRISPFYVGASGDVERVFGVLASDNYFTALRVQPALGRFFTAEEHAEAAPVAVISYGLWHKRFGGDRAALGRTVRVNARDLTVVGVTSAEFQGTVLGLQFDVWAPSTLAPLLGQGSRELEQRNVRGVLLLGKLRDGVSREQAQAEVDAAMSALAQAYPDTNANLRAELLPFWSAPRGPQRLLTAALGVLQAIMLLLLLAVCGNMANLVLARASARYKEIGIRLTLGASPSRIVSLVLTENVLLALGGAALGAALAMWGTQALQVIPLTGMPLRFQTSVNAGGLTFAVTLGVLCGLLFGAVPALHLARIDPQTAFRSIGRGAGRHTFRHWLMGIQAALAIAVLLVAGISIQSFLDTRHTDTGFRRDGVLLAAYDFSGRSAPTDFAHRLTERLRAIPGIEDAAIASAVPLDIHGLPTRAFTLEGRARDDGRFDEAATNTVTPNYFRVMETPIVKGAGFAPLDDAAAPAEAVVNEAFVARFMPSLEPLGRRITTRSRAYTIVGVVRDSLYNAYGEPPTPAIFLSYRDAPLARGEIHLLVGRGRETTIANDVRRGVGELDPELPLFNFRTMNAHVDTNLIFRRIPAQMFSVLGPLLLALAAIGIYAVVAYAVSQRTREIGVRLALGATARGVSSELAGAHMRVVTVGALVGWMVAVVVALNIVGASVDFAVFAGVPAVLLSVAALACWLPIRRATRVDPMVALRQE